MEELLLQVKAEEARMRLDLLLTDYALHNNLGLSRTNIQKLIHEGKVFLNSQMVNKPHHKLKALDQLQIFLPEKEQTEFLPEEIPLDIVYEDKDVLVINKQAGLVVHPAPGNRRHTLVNALLGRSTPLSDQALPDGARHQRRAPGGRPARKGQHDLGRAPGTRQPPVIAAGK